MIYCLAKQLEHRTSPCDMYPIVHKQKCHLIQLNFITISILNQTKFQIFFYPFLQIWRGGGVL